jgi:hypothetical protein
LSKVRRRRRRRRKRRRGRGRRRRIIIRWIRRRRKRRKKKKKKKNPNPSVVSFVSDYFFQPLFVILFSPFFFLAKFCFGHVFLNPDF